MRDDTALRLRSYIAFLRCMPRMPIATMICLLVSAIAALKAGTGAPPFPATRARRADPAPARAQRPEQGIPS
jgi:hypothetical protein